MEQNRDDVQPEEHVIALTGRIDATNAADLDALLASECKAHPHASFVLDASKLSFISSAGLRSLLRLVKEHLETRVVNVLPDVYEVFEMTGFNEIVSVERAYRRISVDGCEVIGSGANGKVYRIDPETIVKVYRDANALPEIKRERELARTAFVLGIPTAIPYDVVRVGNGYGSVFELLDAQSFEQLLKSGEIGVSEVADRSVDLLHQIHDTEVNAGILTDMNEVFKTRVAALADALPSEVFNKLTALAEALPDHRHMLHGDFHVKNVMVYHGECLLIDMDTLAMGHPVFELGAMYATYLGFTELDHDNLMQFMGIPYETGEELFNTTFSRYFEGRSAEELEQILNKVKVVCYVRMLERNLRKNKSDELSLAERECFANHLCELAGQVDELSF